MSLTSTIAVIALIVMAVFGIAGAYFSTENKLPPSLPQVALKPTPTPTESNTPSAEPSPTEEPEPTQAVPPPAQPPMSQPAGPIPATPTPQPVAPIPAEPNSSPVPSKIGIEFIDLPASVGAGQPFTVRWRVTGPLGAIGDDTTLNVSFENSSENDESSSRVSSNTSHSFGSFEVPRIFSSQLSFGDSTGPVNIDVIARVQGRTISSHRVIQLQ